MRKNLLLIVALCSLNAAFAQFYISGQGGYSMGSAGILTGTSLNEAQNKATNHYGSYGEGANAQLKFGYFWNEMFGFEVGFGNLWGADQNISSYELDSDQNVTEYTEGFARATAVGLNLALVYNFNEHFYGKVGVISKLGGKTEAEFTNYKNTPFGPIVTEGVNDYHGRPPLGFTAVFGYKHSLGGNWHAFVEAEYLGINVRRNDSEFQSLTITTPDVPGSAFYPGSPAVPSNTWNLGDAPYLWLDEVPGLPEENVKTIYAPSEISYEDSLPVPNNDPSKALSSVAPYSSFGVNIGVTYTFNKKSK